MDYVIADSRYRRRKYLQATSICDTLLSKNSKDEHAQILKCQCLIKQNQFDELEFQQEGVADQLMNETVDKNKSNRIATSLGTSHNPIIHPTSQAGRIVSGYQRPGTSRQVSRAGSRRVQNILSRAGNPITSNGRVLRLGTASLIQSGQNMLNVDRLDLKILAKKKNLSRVVFKYLFYVDHNLKRALQLAAYATQFADFNDPWWKVAIGKCYYHMGVPEEAQKQFKSSIKHNNNIESYLYLSKINLKRQQFQESINILTEAQSLYPKQIVLNLHIARIYEMLNDLDNSFNYFKSVLDFQNCNLEAVASIAAYYFYKGQSQISIRLYQRVIQLGMGTAEVWNNMGLCCFQTGKYELFYSCFQRALANTSDEYSLSDIWYNIGNIYINFGTLDSAEMCYKTSLNYNPNNAQSLNNLSVIQFKANNMDSALSYAEKSYKASQEFDACYNLSIWNFKLNDLKNAKYYNQQALKIYPDHYDSLQLQKKIQMIIS